MVGAYLVLLSYHLLRKPVKGAQAAGLRKPALLHARPIARKRYLSLDWRMAYGGSIPRLGFGSVYRGWVSEYSESRLSRDFSFVPNELSGDL